MVISFRDPFSHDSSKEIQPACCPSAGCGITRPRVKPVSMTVDVNGFAGSIGESVE